MQRECLRCVVGGMFSVVTAKSLFLLLFEIFLCAAGCVLDMDRCPIFGHLLLDRYWTLLHVDDEELTLRECDEELCAARMPEKICECLCLCLDRRFLQDKRDLACKILGLGWDREEFFGDIEVVDLYSIASVHADRE